MRGKRGASAAAVGLVAAFVVVGPGQADNDFKNKYDSQETVYDCGDSSTITYSGPLKMWPPNHKLQDVSVTATDGDAEPATDGTTLALTFDVLDAVGGDGGPRHDPDVLYSGAPTASGTREATVPFQLRSERSGKGEGRTYEIHADATFDNGLSSCSHTFVVTVPHDMRGGADWR